MANARRARTKISGRSMIQQDEPTLRVPVATANFVRRHLEIPANDKEPPVGNETTSDMVEYGLVLHTSACSITQVSAADQDPVRQHQWHVGQDEAGSPAVAITSFRRRHPYRAIPQRGQGRNTG